MHDLSLSPTEDLEKSRVMWQERGQITAYETPGTEKEHNKGKGAGLNSRS